MTAAADGHTDIVKLLLQNDADIDLKDAQGWKASDHAVMNGIHRYITMITVRTSATPMYSVQSYRLRPFT